MYLANENLLMGEVETGETLIGGRNKIVIGTRNGIFTRTFP